MRVFINKLCKKDQAKIRKWHREHMKELRKRKADAKKVIPKIARHG